MTTPKPPRADRPKQPAERRSGSEKPAPVDLRSEPVTAMGLAEVTHAATLCFGMAAAIHGHADLDKPNDATFSAAEGLYEGNHVLHRGLCLSSLPINQLLCSVADSADCNANYGIGITATHCHQIAWLYGQCVLEILHQWNVVGTCEGQVVTDQQHFRQKWPDIQQSLKVLPQIEYAKFLAALDREAARAQTLLRTSPASATTLPAAPKGEGKPVDEKAAKAAQYAALLVSVKSLADGSLKGIQRRVTVLLVEAGGTKAIADIATDKGVGWLAPFKGSVDGYLKGVRPKLQPLGADVKPFDQELRLVLQEKPTRPRLSTKKAAPPKRRQSAASLPPKRR